MIKTTTLSIFLSLLVSLSVSAQEKSRFGLKAGVNVAWQSREQPRHEMSPAFSMHLTGFTEVQLAEKVFLQPGLSLQGKGYRTELNSSPGAGYRPTNMLYLEIPVNLLYKFRLPFGNMIAGGGPYAGLGLSGRERGGSDNVFRGVDGSNGYGNTDYGLNISLGTELSSRFTLTLQQSIGLDNIAPEAYTVPGPADGLEVVNGSIKNRVASVSIGYRF